MTFVDAFTNGGGPKSCPNDHVQLEDSRDQDPEPTSCKMATPKPQKKHSDSRRDEHELVKQHYFIKIH